MARLLRSRAWSVLAVLAGITSLLAADVTWLRLVCAAGLVVGIAQQLALLAISIHRRMLDTFSVRLSAASMLCVGVACWYLANTQGLPFLVLAGSLAVLAAQWWLGTAIKDADVVHLQARNLPGVVNEPVDPPRWPYGWAGVAICAFLVLDFVAATLSLPAAVSFVLAALAVAMVTVTRMQLARFTAYCHEVLDKVRAYGPVLTMPYNGHAAFHIGLWSPYLERTGLPFTVVTTDALAFKRVAERYTIPVIYAAKGDLRAIRAMLPKTLRAALYVYSRDNKDFLRIRRMTHVWLHHGDSDKESSCRRKSAAYDILAVAGQAAIDRYAAHQARIPSSKFKIVGRPQTEDIETATTSICTVEKPVVLYAPTWYAADHKHNHSSLPIGTAIVSALLARNATVIFRPHPANRKLREAAAAIAAIDDLLRADAKATSRPHRWSEAATDPTFAELANAADAMVADVSGVVTDFMQSLKPFAMVATGEKTDTFRARFPS
ncbi:MAG TPA: CDP-glycerol glycerophosphotransferase family protein, partial [Propionibacteriaceae bacterium]|nr:CDP-glycerol glycerophosphotransferase family protein [Propionibacteriaceae bacterium]